jgi:hypothetical protein
MFPVKGCCQLFAYWLSRKLHHEAQNVHRLLYPAKVDDDDNNENKGNIATISLLQLGFYFMDLSTILQHLNN